MVMSRIVGMGAALVRLASLLARSIRTADRTSEAERYLSAAADHADLERRIRELERCNSGPALTTYTH